jgi:predicted DNA-binding protein (UPF0251 family)
MPGGMRGRGRGRRWISQAPSVRIFTPMGQPWGRTPVIVLFLSELEAMRLVDVEGLTQEEAALRMGVSRKTLWNDLQNGRRKVAEALMKGWAIEIHQDEGAVVLDRNERKF